MVEGSEISGVSIGGTSAIANLDLRSAHGVSLTNLQSNTNYYFVILVKDASGNESVTWQSVFRTTN